VVLRVKQEALMPDMDLTPLVFAAIVLIPLALSSLIGGGSDE
jgi:hypothetical protein